MNRNRPGATIVCERTETDRSAMPMSVTAATSAAASAISADMRPGRRGGTGATTPPGGRPGRPFSTEDCDATDVHDIYPTSGDGQRLPAGLAADPRGAGGRGTARRDAEPWRTGHSRTYSAVPAAPHFGTGGGCPCACFA